MPNFFFTFILFLVLGCSIHSNKERPIKNGLDAHVHVHTQDVEDDMEFSGGRALLAVDSIGLNRAIILSNSYSINVSLEWAIKQNDFIFHETMKNPKHLSGACAINPLKSWAVSEMKRCRKLGLKILKLHTMASGMDLKIQKDLLALNQILNEAQRLEFTVLIHGYLPKIKRGNEAEILLRELEKFPQLKIIIGHLLGNEYALLETFKHSHYWVEVSATPIIIRDQSEKLRLVASMRKVGIKKFIFGSDWPVFHPAETLKALQGLSLSDEELDAILFENSKSLDYLF
jgi:predicted TIM-barrel fold metal-dependent hydrolase